MTNLGPKARELVMAGRRALRPTAADRERLDRALQARLGSDVMSAPDRGARVDSERPEATTAPATRSPSWLPAASAAASAVVAVAVVVLALLPSASNRQPEGATQPPSASAPPTPAAAQQAHASSGEPAQTRPAPAIPEATPPRAANMPLERAVGGARAVRAHATQPKLRTRARNRDSTNTLAREVALLSRATRALRAGRNAEALEVLREHERVFPDGAMVEERISARAQALCALGRTEEGLAALARLPPRTPAAARATQACAPQATPGR